MASLRKELAELLGIREVKTGEISHLPKPRDAVKGIARVPKRDIPIKPIGANSHVTEEQWKKDGEIIDSRIEQREKMRYLRPKDKPVRPLELSDWRRLK
ncbi:hypothetical protein ES703_63443 [subsurface metagenome]